MKFTAVKWGGKVAVVVQLWLFKFNTTGDDEFQVLTMPTVQTGDSVSDCLQSQKAMKLMLHKTNRNLVQK
jgi:hypothetical protein